MDATSGGGGLMEGFLGRADMQTRMTRPLAKSSLCKQKGKKRVKEKTLTSRGGSVLDNPSKDAKLWALESSDLGISS